MGLFTTPEGSHRRLVAAGLLTAALLGCRLLVDEGLLGSDRAEIYGHAWVIWWHGQALPAWPDGPVGLLEPARDWPVIDPLPTLLMAALSRLVGLVAAVNLYVLGCVALAFVGGAALARRLGGDPWVGGLGLALCPAFLGSLQSGLTEDGLVGLVALAFAALLGARLRDGLLAGLLLGLLVWCGPVLAFYAGIGALLVGAVSLRPSPRWGPVVGGLTALLVGLPALLAQGARLDGMGHRSGQLARQAEPLWRLNPWQGVDLASFFTPGRPGIGDALIREHPGYLGLALVGLGLWGRRGGWLALAALFALLSTGHQLAWMGRPLDLNNPLVGALTALPGGALLNHFGRALLVGGVALSAAAALGAQRLSPAMRRGAAVLVLAELVLASPMRLPFPVAGVEVPAVLQRLPAEIAGPLLVLPIGGPGIHPQRALLDQRAHGRALLLDPNGGGPPAALRDSPSGRWLASLALPRPAPAPDPFVAPPGVGLIFVASAQQAAVEAVLGPPLDAGPGGALWSLGAGAGD